MDIIIEIITAMLVIVALIIITGLSMAGIAKLFEKYKWFAPFFIILIIASLIVADGNMNRI